MVVRVPFETARGGSESAGSAESAKSAESAESIGSPRWRRALPVAGLAAFAFIAAIAVHRGLMPFDSGDRDEAVYRFQALLLRDGHFSLPASQETFYRPWLSGLHAGRLVLPFTAPWPAVLAVSGVLFGTTLVALGVVASAVTIGCYLFTYELLRKRETALLATALVSLSPLLLILAGTYLNYVLALALELFAAWTLLRGMRANERSTPWLVASGALWTSASWCRPLDGVLVGLPFLALLVLRRVDGGRLASQLGRLVIGAAPVALVVLAVNKKATGGPLSFPVSAQSGGAARPGWGMRGLYKGELTVDYSLGKAFQSLGTNLWALPTWLLGAHLAVALAAYGGWRLWRTDRTTTTLLVAMALICPIGYLGWFANALTTAGAFTGIGPHYYLPSVVPLAVLAAVGAHDLWDRRPALVPIVGALALAATVACVVPKVHVRLRESRYDKRFTRTVEQALTARGDRPALLVLPAANGTDGVMRIAALTNRPDLSGPIVYALDRGPGLFDLVQQQPGRVPFRLTTALRPGAKLSMPEAVVQPINIVEGAVIEVRIRLTNTSPAPVVFATLEQGGRVASVLLDEKSKVGRTYDVTWRLFPDGTVRVQAGGEERPVRVGLAPEGDVGFGIVSGNDRSVADERDPSRAVQRMTYRRVPARNSLQASTAMAEYVRFGGEVGAWLPVDVSEQIRALVTDG